MILILITFLMPCLGAASLLTFARGSEQLTTRLLLLTIGIYDAAVIGLIGFWLATGFQSFEWVLPAFYQNGEHGFEFSFLFDHVTAVFLGMTAYLASIIMRFSSYYMHREPGYTRFFVTLLGFLLGMTVLVLSGSMDTLFAGWEIVGLASFLLIGFYRSRAASVQNALRAYSVYRICDVGILLGAWMSHLLWEGGQRFLQLTDLAASGQLLGASPVLLAAFGLLILLGAIGKSAQFPFCFWLPRAMEGPTPSSAIFYGALSIHAGVFLLLRLFPVWQAIPYIPWIVGLEGGISVLIATVCGRAQSNIKGQIAYASITQVGLMFIELALGFPQLALLHFAGNAGLRCYQLLVSPSAVVHLLQMQGHHGRLLTLSDWSFERLLPLRWRSTLYVFAIEEAYLLKSLEALFVKPLAWLGRSFRQLELLNNRAATLALVLIVTMLSYLYPQHSDIGIVALTGIMIMASIEGLTERLSASKAWHAIGLSSLLMGIIISLADESFDADSWLYFSGMVPAWILGGFVMSRLERREKRVLDLEQWGGAMQLSPGLSYLLLLAFLLLAAFPIGPAFIGEDMLLRHIREGYAAFSLIMAFGFVLNGIALARIYTKICLGPRPDGLFSVDTLRPKLKPELARPYVIHQ